MMNQAPPMLSLLDPHGVEPALLRYRILAWIVGTALCVLVFLGIPLQLAGIDVVVKVAGAIHGFLFIVYLVLILDVTRRTRLPLLHMVLTMAAGLVPGATFYAEVRTTRWVREHLPMADPPTGPPAGVGPVTTIG